MAILSQDYQAVPCAFSRKDYWTARGTSTNLVGQQSGRCHTFIFQNSSCRMETQNNSICLPRVSISEPFYKRMTLPPHCCHTVTTLLGRYPWQTAATKLSHEAWVSRLFQEALQGPHMPLWFPWIALRRPGWACAQAMRIFLGVVPKLEDPKLHGFLLSKPILPEVWNTRVYDVHSLAQHMYMYIH